MAAKRSRARFFYALMLAAPLWVASLPQASGFEMPGPSVRAGSGLTLVQDYPPGISTAKIGEMIEGMKALAAKSLEARAEIEQAIRSSAGRPSQTLLDQYRRFGEQQKEFEGQLKELCGLLAKVDSATKVDECIQIPSK